MKYVCTLLYLLFLFPLTFSYAETISFGTTYAQSEQFLIQKEYGSFGELTQTLVKLRDDEGYSNLVPLSDRLIEAGRGSCSIGDSNCSFFIRSAILLSPTDPWSLFSASTLTPSYKESISLFFSALKNSRNSPTFFYKTAIVSGIFLLALLSLFIALKLLFGVVRFEFKELSPKGILTFAVLALIGLPFGMIATALCWSIIILVFVGKKRQIIHLLVLTLVWIAFLPTAENILRYVSRPEEREYELLLSNVNSPSSNINASKYLNEPLYLGAKFYREGDYEKAKAMFSRVRSEEPAIKSVVTSRIAASQLALKQFPEAKINIGNAHAQGLNSYELVHNEAILAAATTNLNESRTLLDKLKQIDKGRLSKESLSTGILLEPLALSVFSDRYLDPLEMHLQVAPPQIQWISSEKMLTPLCSQGLAGLLALSAVMVGLLIMPTSKIRALV